MLGRRVIKHYVYRMDHDTGFAPHIDDGVCTLCGCKSKTVESWARPGSWVVGIGGNGTGKPDRLIYAMKVEFNPSVAELRRDSPRLVRYLRGHGIAPAATILVSRYFYYFGASAIPVPKQLRKTLIIPAQGCWKVSDGDINRLVAHLEHYARGKHGDPNNTRQQPLTKCGCSRVSAKPRTISTDT